jgi:hypothetical protein
VNGAAWDRKLDRLLRRHGLVVLGASPAVDGGGRSLILVGNAGSGMWRVFRASPEAGDGQPDPLDRWSRRIGQAVAAAVGAEAVFPFDGPPYPPFQLWARRSGAAFDSPIVLTIHGRYGLWHAYRFALRTEHGPALVPARPMEASPCLQCPDQPCLHGCPVAAFAPGRYEVHRCLEYLRERPDSACRAFGCAARRACPVAPAQRYEAEHARFHMDAFVRSQSALD